jgi:hypothetical protein
LGFSAAVTTFHVCYIFGMQDARKKVQRRESRLSREQIVFEAIALLDTEGEEGLTFKALGERLSTGSGAISNKSDLILAACDAIIARVQDASITGDTPQESIRAFALGIFDAIHERPWAGAALMRVPGQQPVIRILESLGREIRILGVPEDEQWTATIALFNYIVGVSGQHAALAQLARQQDLKRSESLEALSQTWSNLDSSQYPFARSIAEKLRTHDDRADFLAGIDFIVIGISVTINSVI